MTTCNQLKHICTVTIFLFASANHASATEAKDIPRIVGEAVTSAVSAKVVTLNPRHLIGNSISEAELSRRGCTYLFNSRADLDALGSILMKAGIVAAEQKNQFGKDGLTFRIGIYLRSNDGSISKLLFETLAPVSQQAFGWVNERESVKALNDAFQMEMHEWTSKFKAEPSPICKPYTGATAIN